MTNTLNTNDINSTKNIHFDFQLAANNVQWEDDEVTEKHSHRNPVRISFHDYLLHLKLPSLDFITFMFET